MQILFSPQNMIILSLNVVIQADSDEKGLGNI
jgi:hypothetical protein